MQLNDYLELAAKAIGHELHINQADAPQLWKDGQYVCFWNPATDNADSRSLQIALRMSLELWENEDGEYWKASAGPATALEWVMNHNDDHEATARMAVLRCAARVAQQNALEVKP